MWRALMSAAVGFALAACGGHATGDDGASPRAARTLERNGISIAVPAGWDGRVLFREATGSIGAIFQVANFELPAQEGLEPPAVTPGGDRIKAMDGRDVLITILSDERSGRAVQPRLGFDDLEPLPRGAPRVPHGHALAEGALCLRGRCFAISVDFGDPEPGASLRREVDAVLASLDVGGQRTIALDGLRLELPHGWHGYARRLGTDDSQPAIWAANVPFAETPTNPEFPAETLRELPASGVVVAAVAAPASGPRRSAPFTDGEVRDFDRPPTLADGRFLERDYEGQPARHVSTAFVEGRLGGRSFHVQVYFGTNEPGAAVREAADAVLASLAV